MSEKRCAVCGTNLTPVEIRVIERQSMSSKRRRRYLCATCRKNEYNNYVESIKKLIEKK